MPSRVQTLSLTLSAIFVCLLGHSLKLARDRTKVYEKLRGQFDTNGDKKLGKDEIARWFAKHAVGKKASGGGSGGDEKGAGEEAAEAAAARRFEDLLAVFDLDGDGSFDDEELGDVMDFADELPGASVETKAGGGDYEELEGLFTIGIGVAGILTIGLLYFEAFRASRAMGQLERELGQRSHAVSELEGDMAGLEQERKALRSAIQKAATVGDGAGGGTGGGGGSAGSTGGPDDGTRQRLGGRRLSLRKQHSPPSVEHLPPPLALTHEKEGKEAVKEAVQDAVEGEGEATAAATSATATAVARLAEVEAALALKAVEASDASELVLSMRHQFEAKLSAYAVQDEKLAMMQQCLQLGRSKYASEGAATGFAVHGGTIFGSLGSASGADMYTTLRPLGQGRRGAFVAKHLASGQEKAMKRYDLAPTGDRTADRHTAQEILSELRTSQAIGKGHPHIVQYENIIETERHIFVLMELVGHTSTTRGVDLFDWITEEWSGAWVPESQAKPLFRQLTLALSHMHAQQVVHGDIKPENAMVVMPMTTTAQGGKPPSLKLIDFGCASFLRHQAEARRAAASAVSASVEQQGMNIVDSYSPPEVLSSGPASGVLPVSANKAIDLYRLGATLFTMLQKCPPREGVSLEAFRRGVVCTGFRWNWLSKEVRDLISQLLALRPQDRPTCEAVLSHPWLAEKEEGAEGGGGGGGGGTPQITKTVSPTTTNPAVSLAAVEVVAGEGGEDSRGTGEEEEEETDTEEETMHDEEDEEGTMDEKKEAGKREQGNGNLLMVVPSLPRAASPDSSFDKKRPAKSAGGSRRRSSGSAHAGGGNGPNSISTSVMKRRRTSSRTTRQNSSYSASSEIGE